MCFDKQFFPELLKLTKHVMASRDTLHQVDVESGDLEGLFQPT